MTALKDDVYMVKRVSTASCYACKKERPVTWSFLLTNESYTFLLVSPFVPAGNIMKMDKPTSSESLFTSLMSKSWSHFRERESIATGCTHQFWLFNLLFMSFTISHSVM